MVLRVGGYVIPRDIFESSKGVSYLLKKGLTVQAESVIAEIDGALTNCAVISSKDDQRQTLIPVGLIIGIRPVGDGVFVEKEKAFHGGGASF